MYQITNIFCLNYNIIISYFFQKIKKNVLQAASWLPSKLQPKFLHAIWQCVRLLDFVERDLPVRLTLLSFDVLLNSLHSHFMAVHIYSILALPNSYLVSQSLDDSAIYFVCEYIIIISYFFQNVNNYFLIFTKVCQSR